MRTQMIEVDEGMFQVITIDEEGRVTVDMYTGRDAYDRHMRISTHEYRNEHGHTGDLHSGRVAGTSNSSRVWH